MNYVFDAELWRWAARTTELWTFVSVPAEASDEIREVVGDLTNGFGSVRVEVTIGTSTWRTSIFPGEAGGQYSLPIKKKIRDAEGIALGDGVSVELELVDF